MVKRQTSECCRTADRSRHNGPPCMEPPNENSPERGYNRPLASRYTPLLPRLPLFTLYNASSCIIYGVSYLILYSLINLRCWLSWQFLIQSDAADCLDSIIGRQRVERMHAGWNHNYIKILHLLSSVKLKRAQPIDNFCDVNFAVDGQRAQNRKGWHPPVLPWRHVVRDARGRRNEEDVR